MKEGWEYKKLGEITIQISDGSHNPPKGIEFSNYPMLSSKNIFFDKYDYDSPRYLSKEDFETENKRTNISDGDVLLTIVGTVGRTCCVQEPFTPFTLQRSVAVLKPKKNIITPRFMMYFLHSLSDYWEIEAKGVAQKGVYLKQVGKISIPVPSLSEQQHIVEELDLLSSIIEKKKAQLNELDNLAQSLFYDMFGDPITNEKGWDVKKLKDACTCITDGDHMPPPKADKGIPFITISNIDKQYREIDFRETFFVPQNYYDSLKEERKAQIGDVLYTVTGSYGIPIMLNESRKFCFQRHIALLRPNKLMISPCYLCYWALCKSIKYMADDVATGIAQKTVGLSSLRKFPIIIPPLSLQQQFASKIAAIEHQKELIKQSIKEVETLFNSRMDYYFN
jgi:type I restriction enzyme S subunit